MKKASRSYREEWPKPAQYLEYVKAIHSINPLKTIRLTGGEPTLYPFLAELIFLLKSIGIERLSMTSNAFKLKRLIPDLREAGLDALNISLDALRPKLMQEISHHPQAERALESIEALLDFEKKAKKKQSKTKKIELKVNCTLWRGVNHTEIVPMLDYFGKRGISVRYLELMNMGPLYKNFQDHLYTQKEILRDIARYHSFKPLPLIPSSTAKYWETKEKWVFGIIANHSAPFCADCDRLRMDSRGRLYGCLSSAQSIPFPVSMKKGELEASLKKALSQKQALRFQGSELSMRSIGG